MIHVDVDRSDINRVVYALRDVKDGAPTAIVRSVNKSLTGVETDMAKETAAELNLTQKRIKKDITITKASKVRMHGVVTSEGRPVNLEQFGAKQKKRGVSVKVRKDSKRSVIPGTFIFLGKGGKDEDGNQEKNRLVGWRDKEGPGGQHVGTKKKKPGMVYAALPHDYRFTIETLYGPRIQDITGKPAIMKKIEDQAGVRLVKELDHQVDYLLKKHKGLL